MSLVFWPFAFVPLIVRVRVDFSWAFLNDANFENAIIGWADFGGTDLSTVNGLETLLHTMPSSIGIDTLVKSRGRIPAAFLRGAGLPDTFIEFAKSLVSEPIQFYSCFISYSTMDQAFADRIYADLQANGVRCWFAPEDVKGGKKLHEQIDEAIRIHDRLLLILSEHSMNSEWVKTEIASARAREVTERRQMLFPISLVPQRGQIQTVQRHIDLEDLFTVTHVEGAAFQRQTPPGSPLSPRFW